MVVVDTSIIIDHLRQPPELSKLIKLLHNNENENFAVSIISVQELYEGQSTKSTNEENRLIELLGIFDLLSYDFVVAEKAGMIARDTNSPIEFADAAIAATAIINGAALATLNEKHFKSIPHLKLQSASS